MDQLTANGRASTASIAETTAETDAIYQDKIRKLSGLTHRGLVKWHTVDAFAIPTLSFARVMTAYEASFGGENLRLMETGYEKQNHLGGIAALSSVFPALRTREMESVVLSLYLLDTNGRPTFKFPNVASVYDLFNEVKAQQSDITGFLNAIDAAAAEEQGK